MQNPVARKDGMSSVGKLTRLCTYAHTPVMCEAEGCVTPARAAYKDQSGLIFDLCVEHERLHVVEAISA